MQKLLALFERPFLATPGAAASSAPSIRLGFMLLRALVVSCAATASSRRGRWEGCASKTLESCNCLEQKQRMPQRLLSRTVEEHLAYATRVESKEERLRRLEKYWLPGLKTAAGFAFAFSCSILMSYLVLAPVEPNFEVLQAGFVSLNITPVTPAEIAEQQKTGIYFGAYFMFNALCVIRYENPNRKVNIVVDHLDLLILYNGFNLGSTMSSSFVQARRTSRLVYVNIVQSNLPVPLNVYYSMARDLNNRRITFSCDLTMKGRLSTVSGIKSPTFRARVRCELIMVNYTIVDRYCRMENLG